MSQVLKTFHLELSLESLFAAPTVAEMAAVIAEYQGKQISGAALDGLLAEIETMSDEEARELLSWEKTSRTP